MTRNASLFAARQRSILDFVHNWKRKLENSHKTKKDNSKKIRIALVHNSQDKKQFE